MRKMLLALAVALTPAIAAAQGAPAPPVPAPEALLAQQEIGKWSGPGAWVSKDLLLLGRADRETDNTKLWFWSRQAGVFEVKLPASLAPADTPDLDSFCAGDGVVQWIGPAPQRRSGMPAAVPERQVFQLIVDPATKESRLDAGRREQIIGTMGDMVAINKTGPATSGFFHLRNPNCRMVSAVAATEGLKRIPELFDVPYMNLYPIANGEYLVSWDPRSIGPDGKPDYRYKYLVLSSVFKPREPQPEKPELLRNPLGSTPFGSLAMIDIAPQTDEPKFQLQVISPTGRKSAIAVSPPGFAWWISVSPDGCALRINLTERTRLMVVRPMPYPVRPPGPQRLGPAVDGTEYSIIDLCSPESRKLLEAAK
jgi:hypothetical protein